MYVYNAAWLILAIVLTALILAASLWAWRSRGFRPALFGIGMALIPMALYLTGTLRVLGVIADQISGFVVGFAFSPKVWIGVILGTTGAVLMGIASMLKRRGIGVRRSPAKPTPASTTGASAAVSAPRSPSRDAELDDIEAILRRHGIS